MARMKITPKHKKSPCKKTFICYFKPKELIIHLNLPKTLLLNLIVKYIKKYSNCVHKMSRQAKNALKEASELYVGQLLENRKFSSNFRFKVT